MRARQITNLFFTVLFIGAGVFAGAFLYRDYQHLDNLQSENKLLSKRKEVLSRESAKRELQLQKLKHDNEYIESIIRTKLNYAKDDEIIFRFER